jgi:hypothetical protein
MLLKQQETQRNIAFGAAVFGGFMAAELLSVYTLAKTEVKGVEQMALEIGFGTGAAVAMDSAVFAKDITRDDMLMRTAVIVGADVLGTYARDVLTSRL